MRGIPVGSIPGVAMSPTLERTLSRNLDAYVAVAGEVEGFCAEQGLTKAVTFKMRLVLEELVLNLIDHGISPATDRIGLRIDVEPERVTLLVEDDSAPFDPQSVPAFDKSRPLEERGPRGMGIQLVRSAARHISYERAGSCNRVRVEIAR